MNNRVQIFFNVYSQNLFFLAGRDKLAAASASRYVSTGKKSSADIRVAESEREAARESLILQIVAPIGV